MEKNCQKPQRLRKALNEARGMGCFPGGPSFHSWFSPLRNTARVPPCVVRQVHLFMEALLLSSLRHAVASLKINNNLKWSKYFWHLGRKMKAPATWVGGSKRWDVIKEYGSPGRGTHSLHPQPLLSPPCVGWGGDAGQPAKEHYFLLLSWLRWHWFIGPCRF